MGVMGRLALGLALVWLDLHVVGLDLLADPVGWAVAGLALRQVGHRHPMLMVAAGCSGVAAVVSLVTWAPVWGAPPEPPVLLVAVEGLLAVVVVVTTCSALVALLAASDPSGARQAGVVRWLDPAVAVAALALTGAVTHSPAAAVDAAGASGALSAAALLLIGAGLLVRVWFLVLVVRRGPRIMEERPTAEPAASPV